MAAIAKVKPTFTRTQIAGLLLGLMAFAGCGFLGYQQFTASQAADAATATANGAAAEAQRELDQHEHVRALARQVKPLLQPLCDAPPPVVEALVLATTTYPGLAMRVTGNGPDPRVAQASEHAAAITVEVQGSERALAAFLAQVDGLATPGASLRRNVTINSISRTRASEDVSAPAADDAIQATLTFTAYSVDASICEGIKRVAAQ